MIPINIDFNRKLQDTDRDLVQEATDLVDALSKMPEVKAINVTIGEISMQVDFKISLFTKLKYPKISEETEETLRQWAPKGFTVFAQHKISGLW